MMFSRLLIARRVIGRKLVSTLPKKWNFFGLKLIR
jgi:hypothetical protein